ALAHRQPPAQLLPAHHRHHPAVDYPPGRQLYERRLANGNTRREALRVLKRRLSDVVYRCLKADATISPLT
ncbi:hypothetical protein ACFOZ4_04935, partial [Hamadaea flava]